MTDHTNQTFKLYSAQGFRVTDSMRNTFMVKQVIVLDLKKSKTNTRFGSHFDSDVGRVRWINVR